jgi:hypothetical protein
MFGPLLREPLGDAIVNDGLAITIDTKLFAVDPPHRCHVGANSQSHITHLAWTVDDGHSLEQNIGSLLALSAGEVKEVDIIILGNAILPAMNKEAVKMIVGPSKCDL